VIKGLNEVDSIVELDLGDGSIVTSELVTGGDGLRSTVRKAVAHDLQPYHNGFNVMYGLAEKGHIDEEAQTFLILSTILRLEGSFGITPIDPSGDRLGFLTSLQLPDRPMEAWRAFQKDKVGLRALLAESFCKGNQPRTIQELCEGTLEDEISSWP
jgi:2-polyprenyl-6-methoxyphenol hydroxylase-like FAD-dependent oxidoreductase